MKIEYTYTTDMTIIYDAEFKVFIHDSLDEAVARAKEDMSVHAFNCAEIIDSNTKSTLAVIDYWKTSYDDTFEDEEDEEDE